MSLGQQTVSGVAWTTVQRFATLFLAFVANLVLARLLSPDDFGCIALLMVFISLSQIFVDGGFGAALIQKKDPTQDDYSTIFYWNLLLALGLYFLLFFLAPVIARYYEIPILKEILRVQGLIIILDSFGLVHKNNLRKTLQFKKISLIVLGANLIAVIIAITMAYNGFGVWCLVAQQLLISGMSTVLYWIFNRWKPSLVFSKKSFKELFGFGGFILLSNMIVTFANEVQALIMGKMYTARDVGLYSQARKFESIMSNTASTVVNQVTFPIFSKFQDDLEHLQNILRRITKVMAFVVFPAMILVILIAKPAIVLMLTDKWVDCVPFFQILCIGGMAEALGDINYNAVAAIGKSRVLFRWTCIKSVLGLLLIIAGSFFGVRGIIWAVTIRFYLVFLIHASLAAHYLNFSIFIQLKDLFDIALVAAAAGAVAYLIGAKLFVGLNMYYIAVIQIVIYAIAYLLLAFVFNRPMFGEVKYIIGTFLHKKK
ncbi:MAG: lipopolysaccharide biosynthesis protein [Bacteroidales bacterium]|nr:lipopolysaccharide biosynthesis protein [Bacteroidales bacterium]